MEITVTARITEDAEVKLTFAKKKIALDVRNQLTAAGYEANAVVISKLE